MSTENNRGGVRQVAVDADRDGQRVDNFLAAQLKGVPKSAVYRMIRTGQVRINGRRCKAATRLAEGDHVRIPPARFLSKDKVEVSTRVLEQISRAIVCENDDLLVIDKPCGMAVHSGSGLAWGIIDVLRQLRPGDYLELVHRLDRDTSGCLVVARSGKALNALSAQFREGSVGKFYLCMLDGALQQALVEVDAPLQKTEGGARRQVRVTPEGKSAKTRFKLLHAYNAGSFAEAELLTGRTHQIRVHAQHLGLPLAGDPLYSSREALRKWRALKLKRLFLHAHRVRLTTPGGKTLDVSAPLPDELSSVLDRLEGAAGDPPIPVG